MKNLVGALAMASFGMSVAHAEPADPVKSYAQLLHHGAFMCKLESENYDAAVRYQSAKQGDIGEKVGACIREYSVKAKEGLPVAIKAAKNDAVKTAIKTLYTDWNAYFGEFDRLSESRYERSESALQTELLTSQ